MPRCRSAEHDQPLQASRSLAVGGWRLVVGCWRLAAGPAVAPCSECSKFQRGRVTVDVVAPLPATLDTPTTPRPHTCTVQRPARLPSSCLHARH